MLIKCRECEKEYSDKVANCIHCGCPTIEVNETNEKINRILEHSENSQSRGIFTSMIGSIMSLLAMGIVLLPTWNWWKRGFFYFVFGGVLLFVIGVITALISDHWFYHTFKVLYAMDIFIITIVILILIVLELRVRKKIKTMNIIHKKANFKALLPNGRLTKKLATFGWFTRQIVNLFIGSFSIIIVFLVIALIDTEFLKDLFSKNELIIMFMFSFFTPIIFIEYKVGKYQDSQEENNL